MKELTHKEMSRKGGLATKKKGKKYYKLISLKGNYAQGYYTKEEYEAKVKELTKA